MGDRFLLEILGSGNGARHNTREGGMGRLWDGCFEMPLLFLSAPFEKP